MTRLLIGTLAVDLLLLAPVWLRALSFSPWLALEALVIAPLLALPALRWARPLRLVAVAGVVLALLLGIGDAATRHTLGRALNVYLDMRLLSGAYDLMTGALGSLIAVLIVIAALGLTVAAFLGLERAASRLQGAASAGAPLAVAVLMLAAGSAGLAAELTRDRGVPVTRAPMVDTLAFQIQQVVETRRARVAFEADLSDNDGPVRALNGLAGRDVLLVFVESYGADVLDRPPWRDWLAPRLADMEQRLAGAGLKVVSGTMRSPIRGGQSWLAHLTALSGVVVDNDYRYRLLLAADRPTLVDDFRATGHRSVAVAPAITKAWPAGRAYGFDAIHAASDLDYAGPSLNWVTMPDQYTLHRFQQDVRPSQAPVFAMVSLISSHAPWTPILPVLEDWESVGDGRVFRQWRDAGQAPEALWQDLSRVRAHHARALDYTLSVVARWAATFLDKDDLLIVMGDHPAAPLISGEEAGHAVPVHLISGDPSLLSPFSARGFVPGTRPPQPARQDPPGMEALRDWLHAGFAGAGGAR